ncbi:hypothetical protein C2845_PM16G06130 [Panicum miliaceum]|uniref:Ubiquitin-like protease family profile domain-containing protein n=1 Tax=Panicum miliaceum TaxID=4540 RepID=A0A3L6PT98_PANMI|nr:hypothetical protein C2845_PM16G06130 [Panicum miliaceum]
MPVFPATAGGGGGVVPRRVLPTHSSPAGGSGRGHHASSSSPASSDDEASGGSSITNRCSPKAVYMVVCKFSEYKKQLVRDIGFRGILDMPGINKDRFKVAFVIFVMGHLLAPSAKDDHGNLDFWGALKNPDLTEGFNWCRYVFCHVLESARRFRDAIFRKGSVTCFTGCHLFLQIVFLDNIEIRRMNKPHNIIPHIKVFDPDPMRKMILMCSSHDGNDFSVFMKIRSTDNCAYMRYTFQSPHTYVVDVATRTPAPMLVSPVQASSSLPPSSPVISPGTFTFKHPSDLGLYIRNKCPGLERTYAIDFIKMHNVQMLQDVYNMRSCLMRRYAELVDWLVEHVGATQLQLIHKRPSFSSRTPESSHRSDVADSPSDTNSSTNESFDVKRRNSETGDSIAKKLKTTTVREYISKSPLTPVQLKTATTPNFVDSAPDAPSFDLGLDNSPASVQLVTLQAQYARNYVNDIVDVWEDGMDHEGLVLYLKPIGHDLHKFAIPPSPPFVPTWSDFQPHAAPDQMAVYLVYNWCQMASFDDTKCPWIVHKLPRFLSITGCELNGNILGDQLLNIDVMDAILRRFNHLDVPIKSNDSCIRWRHFFESSFAVIVPLVIDSVWCEYMLNINTTEVHILDPCHSTERFELIADTFKRYYLISGDSGICMLHLARYYNGDVLESLVSKESIKDLRKSLLYEAICIDGNDAELPPLLKWIMR